LWKKYGIGFLTIVGISANFWPDIAVLPHILIQLTAMDCSTDNGTVSFRLSFFSQTIPKSRVTNFLSCHKQIQ